MRLRIIRRSGNLDAIGTCAELPMTWGFGLIATDSHSQEGKSAPESLDKGLPFFLFLNLSALRDRST